MGKLSDDDIQKSVFIPNKEKQLEELSVNDDVGTLYYDISGQSVDEDSPEIYAKKVTTRHSIKHFVLQKKGKFANPYGLYDVKVNKVTKGLNEWTLRQVTKASFDNYIEFLKTKNQAFVRIAERENI